MTFGIILAVLFGLFVAVLVTRRSARRPVRGRSGRDGSWWTGGSGGTSYGSSSNGGSSCGGGASCGGGSSCGGGGCGGGGG